MKQVLNEGYWGHLPLQNDSALDEFGEVAYKNIEEQLKNIDKNWDDKLSVFTYLGVIMYMLQIYNFFYSLKSLDKKFDFTNRINKAIKYIDDEKFINTWKNPDEVKEYIKKLPDTIKDILDKNSLGSDNFKQLKVTVPCNEGKNYVNMDVDVREGGRHAVKMTVDEFKQEMIHTYHMYAMEQGKEYDFDLHLTPTPDNFVYSLCYKNRDNEKSKYAAKLYNDIWDGKYKFDSENVNAYGGIKMSKKGFPYIQCDAGGDWECPVCFFVYFDGSHFRGYIPLKGNAINRNNNTAFQGSGDEEEAKFIAKEMGIGYEKAKSLTGDIKFNEDACLKDFLSRVEVKGTYKKRDYTKDEETFKQYRKEKIADVKKRSEEAERRRQMNAQENNGEPDDSEEINETVRSILNKFVFEVKATVDDVYNKYYSNIDRNVFNAAIAADPTAKNGGMGKYTKWILNLVKKGMWKPGDTSETRDCLNRFAKIGAKLPKKDIQQYQSVGELYQALQDASGVKTRSEVKGEGAERVYEDDNWIVIHPKTKEAAIYYGKGTQWCTAATESENMFDYYNEQGPLYIIINKGNPDLKWQFHAESRQFMNDNDISTEFDELSDYGDTDGLFSFIQSIDNELYFFPNKKFELAIEKLKNGANIKDVFDNVQKIDNNYTLISFYFANSDDYSEPNYRFNIIDKNYKLIFKDWLDDAYEIGDGYIIGKIEGSYNIYNVHIKRWILTKGVDYIDENFKSEYSDIFKIKLHNKWNIVRGDGQLLSPNQWFDDIGNQYNESFYNGFIPVRVNNKWNLLNINGGLVSQQWFDKVGDFEEGMCGVQLNNKWNFINTKGQLMSHQWFDYVESFSDGFAYVVFNDNDCYIDTNGNIYNEIPSNNEINEIVNNILNKFVFEATATGTGGLPGEFTVPFPTDDDDPSLDRTPGDTCGMHDRVGKSNLDEKRKKVVKNDKGEVVPEKCTVCGEKVGLYIKGEPVYLCSKCGKYYGTMPFKKK